jgi:hypothetical protein
MTSPARTERGFLPKDWDARFAAEAARLRRHYCNLFKFWRACRDKRCRRYVRCCGDSNECLKRRIDEIPRMEQFQARQAVMAATPKQAGPAERSVRQLMPYDVLAPEPAKGALDLRQFEAGRGR